MRCCREEQLLDQVELSPEALAAKQAVGEQLQQFQAQMWQLSRNIPDERQAELMDAVAESMKEAAKQVCADFSLAYCNPHRHNESIRVQIT